MIITFKLVNYKRLNTEKTVIVSSNSIVGKKENKPLKRTWEKRNRQTECVFKKKFKYVNFNKYFFNTSIVSKQFLRCRYTFMKTFKYSNISINFILFTKILML